MGPDGAREFNAWVKTSPNVYYFSMANTATEAGAFAATAPTARWPSSRTGNTSIQGATWRR
ncbi:hypothetical protein LP420_32840 [Massilia sp. B-10]|nr:hypothetical protein LP420_32840 [Massilia sp. B-10]